MVLLFVGFILNNARDYFNCFFYTIIFRVVVFKLVCWTVHCYKLLYLYFGQFSLWPQILSGPYVADYKLFPHKFCCFYYIEQVLIEM